MAYWGLDSVRAPNSRVGREYLYDYVVRELGRTPEFWGRYIGFSRNQMQQSEIDFLRERRCRIAFVYNGVRYRQGANIRGDAGYRSGRQHAEEAVRCAKDLNVPHNVRIYCDLEGWRATPEWLRGWWDAMYMSPYAGRGGIYGRAAEITFAQVQDPLQLPSLLSGRELRRRYPEGYWSSASSTAFREWETGLDPLMRHAAGLEGPGPRDISLYIWTNMPRGPRNPNETVFRGVGAPLISPAIWQYAMDYLRTGGPGTGRVDMNLATEAGYRGMWAWSL